MFIVIFGRDSCHFCVRAKELAEQLKQQNNQINYRYVDIIKEGISKADLEKSVGQPVETVPQIFIDEQPIGGFTEFKAHVDEAPELKALLNGA